EPAHYRKAVGFGHLDVLGEPAGYVRAPANTPSMLAWLNRTSRAVTVPPDLHGCHAFRVPLGGRCPRLPPSVVDRPLSADQEVTYVGTYPPFVYAVPSVPMRVAEAVGARTEVVLIVGRGAVAVLCLALVVAAGFLLAGDGRGLATLVGLALALSPMVLFLMAELAASGPEVAACLCLLAAALSLTRGPDGDDGGRTARVTPPAVAWVALAAGAVVLTTSRSVGPVWLVVLLGVVVLLRGRRLVVTVARAHRRATKVTAVLAAGGAAATVAWRVVVEPKPPLRASTVVSGIWPGLRQVPDVLAHGVGSFGWFDVDLPWPLYAVWAVLVVGLVLLALLVGSTRERRVLAGLLALEVVGAVVFYAAVIRPTSVDFKMQGRYVLPLLVTLPLVAGEIVGGRPERVRAVLRSGTSRVFAVAMAVAAAVHGLAWAANARYYQRSAVFGREYPARWEPWGGWPLWGVVAGCAVVLAWLGVLSDQRAERPVDG
ncbi:MAG TPA: DUF2142 domain-containing protein, partial [Acidimicrobiales bacterium]|nr:DUF2142 domain-containing protein [Acidimicrobiales bacterium]